ncbi:MAG: SMI1/KNR4 family protein [Gemmataceae bacterium]
MAKAGTSIAELWKRIDACLLEHVPKEWLPPGLTEGEIRRAERVLGVRLPDDVRESYGIHNGLPAFEFSYLGHLAPLVRKKNVVGLPMYSVVEHWRSNRDLAKSWTDRPAVHPKGPIAPVWWRREWIPIFDDIQGNHFFLDLKPRKGGVRGQIVDFDRSYGPLKVYVKSFGAWLKRVARDLERGEYLFGKPDHINKSVHLMTKL